MASADLTLYVPGDCRLLDVPAGASESALKEAIAGVFGKLPTASFVLYKRNTQVACALTVTLRGEFDVAWTPNGFHGHSVEGTESLRDILRDTVARPIMGAVDALGDSLCKKMDALGEKMDALSDSLGKKMDALGEKMDAVSAQMAQVQTVVGGMQKPSPGKSDKSTKSRRSTVDTAELQVGIGEALPSSAISQSLIVCATQVSDGAPRT